MNISEHIHFKVETIIKDWFEKIEYLKNRLFSFITLN